MPPKKRLEIIIPFITKSFVIDWMLRMHFLGPRYRSKVRSAPKTSSLEVPKGEACVGSVLVLC